MSETLTPTSTSRGHRLRVWVGHHPVLSGVLIVALILTIWVGYERFSPGDDGPVSTPPVVNQAPTGSQAAEDVAVRYQKSLYAGDFDTLCALSASPASCRSVHQNNDRTYELAEPVHVVRSEQVHSVAGAINQETLTAVLTEVSVKGQDPDQIIVVVNPDNQVEMRIWVNEDNARYPLDVIVRTELQST